MFCNTCGSQIEEGAELKTKKSKTPLIVAGIVVAVVAITCLVIFVIKPMFKPDYQKALDAYFTALSDKDMDAFDAARYPEEILEYEANQIMNGRTSYVELYTRIFGFTRGYLESDITWGNEEVCDILYKSYPEFNPEKYGGRDGFIEACRDEKKSKKMMNDFSVSYKLLDIQNFQDVTLYRHDGLKAVEQTDMDQVITYRDKDGNGQLLDIDDLYVARIHFEWKYGDKKYGYDKDWFKEKAITDMWQETYEKRVEPFEKIPTTVLIYQYEGEWYVYPASLTMFGIRFSYE